MEGLLEIFLEMVILINQQYVNNSFTFRPNGASVKFNNYMIYYSNIARYTYACQQ